MKPWRLLDGAHYVPAAKTDLRESFKRYRKEMEKEQKKANVTPIKRKSA